VEDLIKVDHNTGGRAKRNANEYRELTVKHTLISSHLRDYAIY